MNKTFRIEVIKMPEGGFMVRIPALPGSAAYGENMKHALEKAKRIIFDHLSDNQSNTDLIPDDTVSFLMLTKQPICLN